MSYRMKNSSPEPSFSHLNKVTLWEMMISLKKVYCDELLQLALALSLLRVDPNTYLGYDIPESDENIYDLNLGTSWAHAPAPAVHSRRTYVHPKSLDTVLLSYEREVFEDLNALGRYNRIDARRSDVTAYLLNIDDPPAEGAETDGATAPGAGVETGRTPQVVPALLDAPSCSRASGGSEGLVHPWSSDVADDPGLTREDMDLIEDLWKQDVDLGFSLDLFSASKDKDGEELDCLEKLKAAPVPDDDDPPSKNEDNLLSEDLDPWVGLPYTIDLETGEYVLQTDVGDELSVPSVGEPSCSGSSQALVEEQPPSFVIPPSFSLEEALQLIGLDEESSQGSASDKEPPEADRCLPDEQGSEPEGAREGVAAEPARDPDQDMIQTAQFHHPHPHPFQGRMPLVRTVSMEQRWQDLANLLSLPGPPPPPAEPGQMPHPFAHHHHHHHHHHYAGGGGPYQPADNGRGVLLHNATLPPPLADLNATGPYPSVGMGASSNLGSAVATSMNLTNSSEPIGDSNPPSAFKAEGSHDMLYYQNSTTEMNQTTDGFLSSILNDEDLQLMDMAMNEGMYTMRMLDSNNSSNGSSAGATSLQPHEERADASSDSAVSSMGSERVPSVSDGEWMETGSDSGHTAGDHYGMDYHSGKYRPYDYSYNGRQHSGLVASIPEATSRMPPMAQKKHQMYGKRYFQEQGSAGSTTLGSHGTTPSLPAAPVKYEYGEAAAVPGNTFSASMEGAVGPKPPEIKYSCSVEFMRHHPEPRQSLEHVQHNHTYHLPPESVGALQRPVTRDKQRGRKSEEEHLNRDEKRARSMNIPITVSDIINLPMDEFNERLSKYDLSEAQLSLIRDIRRRGKNKVAAQNCRKRKLDQILSLADEVRDMKDRKNRLLMDRDFLLKERQLVKDKFSQLYRHIFQSLRDADGNPYSPYEYSLQQSADGTVLLVPRTNASLLMDKDTMHSHKDHEQHRKE